MGTVFIDLLEEEVGVDLRLEGEEGLSEAGREGRSGLLDTLLSAGNLGSVAGVEVVDGLLGSEF